MLTIKFVINGEERRYEYDDSQRDVANAKVKALKDDKDCTSLLCIKTDGTCVQFKKESKKCFAVQVLFKGSCKLYTYGSMYSVKTGDEVIVNTWEGLRVVQVVYCNKIEKTALRTLTHGRTPQWIQGKFVRF